MWPYEIFFHSSKGNLTRRKILRHGKDSFAFTPKEGVLRIFIALEKFTALCLV
jgi:hypothetical protein